MALVRLTADTLESAFTINDTGGDGSLAYTNGEFVYTGPSPTEVRAHFSVTDSGGDGSLSYDNTTGVFTYTGPSATEVRAHFSVTDSGGDGSLSYDNTTGVFTYTGPSATEVRAHFSATGDLSYDNSTGVISYTAPTAGTGVSISSGAINIGQAVGTTDNVTFNDLIVSGNLTVQGTTTTVNSTTIDLADNIITLNSNATGTPTQDAGIEVERGDDANVSIRWNETTNVWEFTNDGSAYSSISSFSGAYADLTGAPSLATVATSGDYLDLMNTPMLAAVATSGDYNDLNNLPSLFNGDYNNLMNLPTLFSGAYADLTGAPSLATVATSGDYNDLNNLPTITTYSAGTGVTIDGSNAINIGQSVETTDSVTFAAVTISGIVTNSTDAATKQYVDDAVSGFSGSLSGLTDVSITSPTNGQVLKYDGTNWVNDTDATGGGGGGIALTDLSVTDSGGDGSLSYDNTSGVFTYTGPSATEVRAHFTAGTGISISSGVISATGGGGGLTGDITTFDYGSFTRSTFDDQLDYTVNQLSDLGTFKAYNETTINAGEFSGSGNLAVIGSNSREIELSELVDNNWNSGSYTPKTLFLSPLEWVVDKLNDVNFGSFSSGGTTSVNLGTYTNPQIAVSNLAGFPNSSLQNSSITINGTAVSLGGSRTINLADLGTVTITTPSNGQVLKYDGTAWVNAADSTGTSGISLTDLSVTDSGGDGSLSYDNTTGVFTYTGPSATEVRSHFSAGTGITITDGTVATTITQYTDAAARAALSAGTGISYDSSTGAISSTITQYTDAAARAALSAGTGISYDSSTGAISSTITQYTDAAARAAVSVTGDLSYNSSTGVISYTAPTAGTGVSISSGTINIGQAVGTTDNVTFNDLTVSGNLTVSGTTTTINTETINLADNIIILNSNATGSASENAGIEVERGDDTNVSIRWNETSNVWEFTNDGSTYNSIPTSSGISLSSISVTDSGGDGSLTYNNSTGVFTYTGPSATEVRSHFTAGTGITISSGEISATPYLTWEIVSTNTTAVAGKGYFVNTSSGGVTITLPSSATLGDTIRFNDLAGSFATNNLTVARNSHLIQGVADDLLVDEGQASFGLVYSNSTYGWKILEL